MNKRSTYRTLACICASASLLILLPSFEGNTTSRQQPLSEQIPVDFRKVAKQAIPAVVSIKVRGTVSQKRLQGVWGKDGEEGLSNDPLEEFWHNFFGMPSRRQKEPPQPFLGQASGFLISEDGYLVTNSHVIDDAVQINVTLHDGREFAAKVVGHDSNTDIALLKIEATNLPYLVFGDSDNLEVGQWVAAIGNPLGLQASITVGVVSAKGRNNLDLARVEDFIQTDAAINRGNSGGPLLALDGKVEGINTAIVTSMLTGGYMGIGFAIPSNIATHIIEELRATGHVQRGFIGILMQPIDQNLAQSFGLATTQGALVAEVTKDSPAEHADIRRGDIIIKINGLPISSIAALRNTISLMKPLSQVRLTILRDGNTLEIPLQIAEYPDLDKIAVAQYDKLGLEVETITPQLAQTMGLVADSGVVITQVVPGKVVAWAGLKRGAVILEVNQRKVHSKEQFQQALTEAPADRPILFLVKQEGVTRFISIKID